MYADISNYSTYVSIRDYMDIDRPIHMKTNKILMYAGISNYSTYVAMRNYMDIDRTIHI